MMATRTPSRDRRTSLDAEALVSRRPGSGRDEAYVVESGTHVWAVIGSLRRVDWNIAVAARDYGLSEESVRAAIDYHERNKEFIDAFIVLNSEENYE